MAQRRPTSPSLRSGREKIQAHPGGRRRTFPVQNNNVNTPRGAEAGGTTSGSNRPSEPAVASNPQPAVSSRCPVPVLPSFPNAGTRQPPSPRAAPMFTMARGPERDPCQQRHQGWRRQMPQDPSSQAQRAYSLLLTPTYHAFKQVGASSTRNVPAWRLPLSLVVSSAAACCCFCSPRRLRHGCPPPPVLIRSNHSLATAPTR